MATAHFSPFLEDARFNQLFWRIAGRWAGGPLDVRWRVWVLTQCARQCKNLSGDLVEFGVYRGASASMILSYIGLRDGQRLHLFDTFSGIPATELTEAEVAAGFSGHLADTSIIDLKEFLAPWRDQISFVAGDVLQTTTAAETGPLSLAHVDLNAARATKVALDYVYLRLVSGGMIVFDDYGWAGYEDQRAVIDDFFSSRPEAILALPTGQAIVVRL
ncbi:MAG TPA: TylF/MycF/NovP-related O-methyltransferase [Acidimicrobiales bacterium]|nr:TylF/MycF/NovP-related O-methyltransferase [Acidimicrobiales bacterium]